MKFWKFLVCALMIYAFIAALISNQSIAGCLGGPALIYGVYYLIKHRNKKPPEGSDAAALREIADTPGAKEAAEAREKAREKAYLDAAIAGAVQTVLSGAGQAAKDGKRKYEHHFNYSFENRVLKGIVKELKTRGFSVHYYNSDFENDCYHYCDITVKW